MVISDQSVRALVSRMSGVPESDVGRVFDALRLVAAFGVFAEHGISTPIGILSRNRDGGVDLVTEYLSEARNVFISDHSLTDLVADVLQGGRK